MSDRLRGGYVPLHKPLPKDKDDRSSPQSSSNEERRHARKGRGKAHVVYNSDLVDPEYYPVGQTPPPASAGPATGSTLSHHDSHHSTSAASHDVPGYSEARGKSVRILDSESSQNPIARNPSAPSTSDRGTTAAIQDLTREFNQIIANERLNKLEAESRTNRLDEQLDKARAEIEQSKRASWLEDRERTVREREQKSLEGSDNQLSRNGIAGRPPSPSLERRVIVKQQPQGIIDPERQMDALERARRDHQRRQKPAPIRPVSLEDLKNNEKSVAARQLSVSVPASSYSWILSHDTYKAWIIGSNHDYNTSVLWITGSATTGKSAVVQFLHTHWEQNNHQGDLIVSLRHYWLATTAEKTTSGILRELLYQMISKAPDLEEVLNATNVPKQTSIESIQWNLPFLRDIFEKCASKLGERRLFCFIDGVPKDAEQSFMDIIAVVTSIDRKAYRICMAMRQLPERALSQGVISLDHEVEQHGELERHIDSELQGMAVGNTADFEEIRALLFAKGFGDWPWVDGLISTIRRRRAEGHSVAALKAWLNEFDTNVLASKYPQTKFDSFQGKLSIHQISNQARSLIASTAHDSGYVSMSFGHTKSPQTEPVDDMDDSDNRSVFSSTDSIMAAGAVEPEPKAQLIAAFTNLVLEEIHERFEPVEIASVAQAMPELVRNFAEDLRIQPDSADFALQRHTAAFIWLNSNAIVKEIRLRLDQLVEFPTIDTPGPSGPNDLPSAVDKLALLWVGESAPFGVPEIPSAISDDFPDPNHEEDEAESLLPIPQFEQARELVSSSVAFSAMIDSVNAAAELTTQPSSIRDFVNLSLLSLQGRQNNTGSRRTRASTVNCTIDWDPVTFLREQFVDNLEDADLRNIIILTRSEEGVQAATSMEYVQQVWPIGAKILEGLYAYTHECLVRPASAVPDFNVELPAAARVEFGLRSGRLFVTIRGLPHHILSLIELFAWLGAACRQHTASGKLGLCSPKVAFFQDQAAFSINYELADFDSPKSTDNSSCWYALINNPVIVDAFPTRRRRYGERGLELPLQLMVELGLVDYVTPYKGGLVLNGIQTMFVPIVQHDKSQSIEWHFLYEEDRCIAMAQADEACPSRLTLQQLSEADLTDARHFVGWTSHVDTRFGANDAKYHRVGPSGLSRCKPGLVLEKATISGGKGINVGVSFGRGVKDKSIRFEASRSYRMMIGTAAEKSVVLYDTGAARGWLTDGASALLHLARSQISLLGLEDARLQEYCPPEPTGVVIPEPGTGAGNATPPKSCRAALLDDRNRNIEVDRYADNDREEVLLEGVWTLKPTRKYKVVLFENLIRDLWQLMGQMFERLASSSSGLPLPSLPNSLLGYLEGYDFSDMVRHSENLLPRSHKLRSQSGRSWLPLVKSTGAIALFGKEFQQLLGPTSAGNKLCENWTSVPRNSEYLVVSVAHLQQIRQNTSERKGDAAEVQELSEDVFWHREPHERRRLFEPCGESCIGLGRAPCDRAQHVRTSSRSRHGYDLSQLSSFAGGAVIFGRSDRIPSPRRPPGQSFSSASAARDSLQVPSSVSDSGYATSSAETSSLGGEPGSPPPASREASPQPSQDDPLPEQQQTDSTAESSQSPRRRRIFDISMIWQRSPRRSRRLGSR